MKKYIIYVDDGVYNFAEYDCFIGTGEDTFHAYTYTEAEIYFFRWMVENGH